MSVQALAAWALGRRQGALPVGSAADRGAQLSQLRRLAGWAPAAGGAFAALAAAAGAMLGDRPTLLGALALAATVVTVPLLLWVLVRSTVARLEASLDARAILESQLEAAREAVEELRNLAYHDGLTGLPNRTLFYDRLGVAIRHSQRQGTQLALLFVDVDDFKDVNDSLGHACGDRLLAELAARLRGSIRAGDTVARLGGDEFVVLLDGVSGPDDAERVAVKLLDAVRAPFRLDGHDVRTTASVGLALYPGDGASPEELVRSADAAMYRHKQRRAADGDAVEGAA